MKFNKKSNNRVRTEYREPFEILIILFVIGLILCLVYPALGENYFRSASILLLVAFAAFATGGLTGFLFGIPKFLQVDDQSPDSRRRYQQNTNLEQVSDWLTKILVGIGLTQLGSITDKLQSVSQFAAKGLSSGPADVVFCGSTLVYFTIVGFFFVYLWSRLQLGRALGDADDLHNPLVVGQLISILDEVEPDLGSRQKEAMTIVRKKLEGQLENIAPSTNPMSKLDELASDYEKTRQSMGAGQDRTRAMGSIVALARSVGGSAGINPMTIFQKGSDGNRIIALGLIRASPKPQYIDIISACIADSRSAFEQYHALRAAETVFNELDDNGKQKIRDSIAEAVKKGNLAPNNSDRWTIAQKLNSMI